MSVNEKIRLVREAKGWTQEEVAEKLQMSGNGYGDIERGETDVKLSRLLQLAELFEIKPAEFFEPNDKASLNVKVKQHRSSFYMNSSNVEMQQFVIDQKDKEIALLKRIIELTEAKK
ncbi:MAG: helix-turn-helix transcriptional regulator [Methylococcales bacterium]|nr:helix-turn-helix transcriptional regulator [Methylococcales bacterium]